MKKCYIKKVISVILMVTIVITMIINTNMQSYAAGKVKIKKGIYYGTYTSTDGKIRPSEMRIRKTKKGYYADLSLYRLFQISDLKVTQSKNKITIKGKDPSGNKLVLEGKLKKNKLKLTVKKSKFSYFKKGDKFSFKVKTIK